LGSDIFDEISRINLAKIAWNSKVQNSPFLAVHLSKGVIRQARGIARSSIAAAPGPFAVDLFALSEKKCNFCRGNRILMMVFT
jgi:hypothetical protein